jgi:hypothetical protein
MITTDNPPFATLTNGRAVGLEDALDALAMGNLAHRERAVEAAIAAGDDDAFISLDALAVAFAHLDLDDNRVARPEFG